MIISNLVSGLGNQLFQYAIGRQISILHDVPLKLDISFFQNSDTPYAYDQLTRSFKLNHYNINATIANETEVEIYKGNYTNRTLYSKIFKRAVKLIPRYRRSYFNELEWWTYEKDLFKVTANVYLDGYWQHFKYFENLSPVIFKELTLKEVYENNYKREIEKDETAVSVHIRRGDYVADGLFALQPLAYYELAVKRVMNKIKNPNFYIFSDDLDWVKDHINFNATTIFVEGQTDYIDLDLMSKCKHNIIANSSFSWWGAMLNKNPEKITVAPYRWVLQDTLNNKIELAFPNWIRI